MSVIQFPQLRATLAAPLDPLRSFAFALTALSRHMRGLPVQTPPIPPPPPAPRVVPFKRP